MMARMDRAGRAAAAALLASALLSSSGIPAASAASTPAAAQTSTLAGAQTYLVVYNQSAVPSDAAVSVAQAGGRLQYSYDAIGVVVATSNNMAFRDNIKKDSRVNEAGQTALGVVRLKDRVGDDNDQGPSATSLQQKPATDNDSLSGLQWDMRQIHAPEAHRITGGSRSVLVADIDTGLDFKHADLKRNIDFENSTSCIGGKPNQSPAAWNDDNGHGTHTAGTIAAGSNGLGIVGVAPNVRIAAIKAGDADGFFFPEAVVCAFMWAGTHDVNVTNNSYFADPFYYNCPSDPIQKAILTAESRAIRFAQNHGVAVVAAAGNFADDLANPTVDIQSPDNATPITRPVDRSCKIVPTTIPGVIVVSADGNLRQKSFYSSYGLGMIDVTAPGGDSLLQLTTDAPNGRVLSTFPPNPTLATLNQCRLSRTITLPSGDPAEPVAFYCYLQGTSMASPHVAGMAALILSRFGNERGSDDENDGRTARLRALIDRAADPIACPSAAVLAQYAFFPQVDSPGSLSPQACTGGRQFNSWYGHGQINVLTALSRGEGDN